MTAKGSLYKREKYKRRMRWNCIEIHFMIISMCILFRQARQLCGIYCSKLFNLVCHCNKLYRLVFIALHSTNWFVIAILSRNCFVTEVYSSNWFVLKKNSITGFHFSSFYKLVCHCNTIYNLVVIAVPLINWFVFQYTL